MKALVFGSLNIDYVYAVDHFVRAGETLASDARNVFCGGKGLNQAIALRRAGVEVWQAGAVGRDDCEPLFQILQDAGVRTELIRRKDVPSGHAIIQKTSTGENCILLYGGANLTISDQEIDAGLERFSPGDFIVVQNETNQTKRLLEKAHDRGMTTVLNPSPMDETILGISSGDVDYLILNEVEGAALCGGTARSEEEMLRQLMADYPKTQILLTAGAAGAYFGYQTEQVFQPAFSVEVVDTTAAGDTFTGFFLGEVMRGAPAARALEIAARAAAIAVSRNGASASVPDLREVISFTQ